MPAIKIKKAVSEACVWHSTHPYYKNTKPLKDCCPCIRTSLHKEVANTSIDDCSEGQNMEFASEGNGHGGTFPEAYQDKKLPPSFAPTSNVLSIQCLPVLETIFSPLLETDKNEIEFINKILSGIDDEMQELPLLVTDDSDDGGCQPCDYQTCSSLDFYISGSCTDGTISFLDLINTSCLDREITSVDIEFDIMFPSNEKIEEKNNASDEDFDESSLYLAIHQMESSEQEGEVIHRSGDDPGIGFFDRNLILCDASEMQGKKLITLVLDLDETLVHSSLEHCEDADFSFQVFFNLKEHKVYVKRRPYLQLFLEAVAQMFEVVIFTASQSIYASQLLDNLDPEKTLISRRFYRESCIFVDGSYIKDLTILGVDLSKVAIIDNSPQVFRLQVSNGIPIKSWFEDPFDRALVSLLPFLETLVDVEDVRPVINKRFGDAE